MITKEQYNFTKRGGIYFTDEIDFADNDEEFTCEQIIFTTDVSLIGSFYAQTSARHLNKDVILVRGKL